MNKGSQTEVLLKAFQDPDDIEYLSSLIKTVDLGCIKDEGNATLLHYVAKHNTNMEVDSLKSSR